MEGGTSPTPAVPHTPGMDPAGDQRRLRQKPAAGQQDFFATMTAPAPDSNSSSNSAAFGAPPPTSGHAAPTSQGLLRTALLSSSQQNHQSDTKNELFQMDDGFDGSDGWGCDSPSAILSNSQPDEKQFEAEDDFAWGDEDGELVLDSPAAAAAPATAPTFDAAAAAPATAPTFDAAAAAPATAPTFDAAPPTPADATTDSASLFAAPPSSATPPFGEVPHADATATASDWAAVPAPEEPATEVQPTAVEELTMPSDAAVVSGADDDGWDDGWSDGGLDIAAGGSEDAAWGAAEVPVAQDSPAESAAHAEEPATVAPSTPAHHEESSSSDFDHHEHGQQSDAATQQHVAEHAHEAATSPTTDHAAEPFGYSSDTHHSASPFEHTAEESSFVAAENAFGAPPQDYGFPPTSNYESQAYSTEQAHSAFEHPAPAHHDAQEEYQARGQSEQAAATESWTSESSAHVAGEQHYAEASASVHHSMTASNWSEESQPHGEASGFFGHHDPSTAESAFQSEMHWQSQPSGQAETTSTTFADQFAQQEHPDTSFDALASELTAEDGENTEWGGDWDIDGDAADPFAQQAPADAHSGNFGTNEAQATTEWQADQPTGQQEQSEASRAFSSPTQHGAFDHSHAQEAFGQPPRDLGHDSQSSQEAVHALSQSSSPFGSVHHHEEQSTHEKADDHHFQHAGTGDFDHQNHFSGSGMQSFATANDEAALHFGHSETVGGFGGEQSYDADQSLGHRQHQGSTTSHQHHEFNYSEQTTTDTGFEAPPIESTEATEDSGWGDDGGWPDESDELAHTSASEETSDYAATDRTTDASSVFGNASTGSFVNTVASSGEFGYGNSSQYGGDFEQSSTASFGAEASSTGATVGESEEQFSDGNSSETGPGLSVSGSVFNQSIGGNSASICEDQVDDAVAAFGETEEQEGLSFGSEPTANEFERTSPPFASESPADSMFGASSTDPFSSSSVPSSPFESKLPSEATVGSELAPVAKSEPQPANDDFLPSADSLFGSSGDSSAPSPFGSFGAPPSAAPSTPFNAPELAEHSISDASDLFGAGPPAAGFDNSASGFGYGQSSDYQQDTYGHSAPSYGQDTSNQFGAAPSDAYGAQSADALFGGSSGSFGQPGFGASPDQQNGYGYGSNDYASQQHNASHQFSGSQHYGAQQHSYGNQSQSFFGRASEGSATSSHEFFGAQTEKHDTPAPFASNDTLQRTSSSLSATSHVSASSGQWNASHQQGHHEPSPAAQYQTHDSGSRGTQPQEFARDASSFFEASTQASQSSDPNSFFGGYQQQPPQDPNAFFGGASQQAPHASNADFETPVPDTPQDPNAFFGSHAPEPPKDATSIYGGDAAEQDAEQSSFSDGRRELSEAANAAASDLHQTYSYQQEHVEDDTSFGEPPGATSNFEQAHQQPEDTTSVAQDTFGRASMISNTESHHSFAASERSLPTPPTDQHAQPNEQQVLEPSSVPATEAVPEPAHHEPAESTEAPAFDGFGHDDSSSAFGAPPQASAESHFGEASSYEAYSGFDHAPGHNGFESAPAMANGTAPAQESSYDGYNEFGAPNESAPAYDGFGAQPSGYNEFGQNYGTNDFGSSPNDMFGAPPPQQDAQSNDYFAQSAPNQQGQQSSDIGATDQHNQYDSSAFGGYDQHETGAYDQQQYYQQPQTSFGGQDQSGAPASFQHSAPQNATHPSYNADYAQQSNAYDQNFGHQQQYGDYQQPYPSYGGAPSYDSAPAATTSNKYKDPTFAPPCCLVAFGFGGNAVTMFPKRKLRLTNIRSPRTTANTFDNNNGELRKGPVNLFRMEHLHPKDQYHDQLEKFPGPLSENVGQESILKYIEDKMKHPSSHSDVDEDTRLLYGILRVLVKSNGKLRADPGTGPSDPNSPEVQLVALLNDSDQRRRGNHPVAFPNAKPVSTHPDAILKSSNKIRDLLLTGDRKGAVEVAMHAQMWPEAMLIASFTDKDEYKRVLTTFLNGHYAAGDPCRTLFLSFADQQEKSVQEPQKLMPSAHQSQPSAILSSWVTHAQVILANRTADTNRILTELGDRLWKEQGNVVAAHVCYLLAGNTVEAPSPNSKIALLGADHRTPKEARFYVSADAVQRTEMYEWIQKQANANSANMIPFQGYKLIHAMVLADHGKLETAFKYVDSMLTTIKAVTATMKPGASMYLEGMQNQLTVLDDRLRQHLGQVRVDSVSSSNGKQGKWGLGSALSIMGKIVNRVVEGNDAPAPGGGASGPPSSNGKQPLFPGAPRSNSGPQPAFQTGPPSQSGSSSAASFDGQHGPPGGMPSYPGTGAPAPTPFPGTGASAPTPFPSTRGSFSTPAPAPGNAPPAGGYGLPPVPRPQQPGMGFGAPPPAPSMAPSAPGPSPPKFQKPTLDLSGDAGKHDMTPVRRTSESKSRSPTAAGNDNKDSLTSGPSSDKGSASPKFKDTKKGGRSKTPPPSNSKAAPSSSSGSSWFSGLSSFIATKMNPEAKVAKLGVQMEAYFDEETKRWVFPGEAETEEATIPSAPPKGPIPSSAPGGSGPPGAGLPGPGSAPASTHAGSQADDPLAALMAPPPARRAMMNKDPVAAMMAPPPPRSLYGAPRAGSAGPKRPPRPQFAVFKPTPQQQQQLQQQQQADAADQDTPPQ